MALSNGTSAGLVLTSLILQGLAGGTLIYVAFFEVLERERTKPSNKLMQWATVLLGFLFMIGLEALSMNNAIIFTIVTQKTSNLEFLY